MSDLICRKSMMRCQTPGTCSPHGGCQDRSFNPDWGRVEAAQESLREHMQIIVQLRAEIESLRKDSERYRALFRDHDGFDYSDWWIGRTKEEVDAMIDEEWLKEKASD